MFSKVLKFLAIIFVVLVLITIVLAVKIMAYLLPIAIVFLILGAMGVLFFTQRKKE